MIPDLPLFVPVASGYGVTHSPLGLFSTDLPLGLAAFIMYQLVLKRPLFALLPAMIQRRCAILARSQLEWSAGFWLRASLAVVVGASTHLAWDSFTHRDRVATRFFPALNKPGLTILGHPQPIYEILQYGCPLVGLPVLMLLLWAWLRRQPPEPTDEFVSVSPAGKGFASLVALAIPVGVVAYLTTRADLSAYQKLGWAITRSGLAEMVAILIYALIFTVRDAWVRPDQARPPATN